MPPRSRAELISALQGKGFEQKPIGGNKVAWLGLEIREEMKGLLEKQ